MERVEERKFYRILKTSFEPREKLEMADQIANAIRNLKKAQDDLASVAAQFKSEIKKFEAEIASLAEKVNSGLEMRSIGCREVKDFNNGTVFVFRDDTEELIEERAMTTEERQREFPWLKGQPIPAAEGESEIVPLTESVTIGHDELVDLPEDTNPFFVGKDKKDG